MGDSFRLQKHRADLKPEWISKPSKPQEDGARHMLKAGREGERRDPKPTVSGELERDFLRKADSQRGQLC